MKKTIEELIADECRSRLGEMSSPQYEFPRKADRYDFISIICSVLACLLLILLCLLGVIV